MYSVSSKNPSDNNNQLAPTVVKGDNDKNRLIDLTIQHFQQIVIDSNQRTNNCKELKNYSVKELLSKGIWYPIDYYKALKKFNQKDRLDWLVNKNAFYQGFIASSDFSPVMDLSSLSGYKICHFEVKKGVAPSIALKNLERKFSLLDCGTVCYLATARALCELLTAEKFDTLFHSDFSSSFYISGTNTSISCLLDEVQITSEEDIQKGDLCRFGSIEKYVHKHPVGSARGFNVVCSNEQSKQYLGLGLSDSGVTQAEIEQTLFNEYNSEPIERELIQPIIWKKIFSQSLLCDENLSKLYVDSLKFDQISWDEFHQQPSRDCKYGTPVKGKLNLIVYRLNATRVQKLTNASLADIRKVFNSFKKR